MASIAPRVADVKSAAEFPVVWFTVIILTGNSLFAHLGEKTTWLIIKGGFNTKVFGRLAGILCYIGVHFTPWEVPKALAGIVLAGLLLAGWPSTTAAPGLTIGTLLEMVDVEQTLITALGIQSTCAILNLLVMVWAKVYRDGFNTLASRLNRPEQVSRMALVLIGGIFGISSALAAKLAQFCKGYDDIIVVVNTAVLLGATYVLKSQDHLSNNLWKASVRLDDAVWFLATWATACKVWDVLQSPGDRSEIARFGFHLGLVAASFLTRHQGARTVWIIGQTVVPIFWAFEMIQGNKNGDGSGPANVVQIAFSIIAAVLNICRFLADSTLLKEERAQTPDEERALASGEELALMASGEEQAPRVSVEEQVQPSGE